jgi:hypothetical protein
MRHFSLCFIDIIDDFHIFLMPIIMILIKKPLRGSDETIVSRMKNKVK